MLVIRQKFIQRIDIQCNRHCLYLFGDNLDRQGMGGQAKEMRGEPNSFGIATKRSISHNYPDDYFFDAQGDVNYIIDEEFDRLYACLFSFVQSSSGGTEAFTTVYTALRLNAATISDS